MAVDNGPFAGISAQPLSRHRESRFIRRGLPRRCASGTADRWWKTRSGESAGLRLEAGVRAGMAREGGVAFDVYPEKVLDAILAADASRRQRRAERTGEAKLPPPRIDRLSLRASERFLDLRISIAQGRAAVGAPTPETFHPLRSPSRAHHRRSGSAWRATRASSCLAVARPGPRHGAFSGVPDAGGAGQGLSSRARTRHRPRASHAFSTTRVPLQGSGD